MFGELLEQKTVSLVVTKKDFIFQFALNYNLNGAVVKLSKGL
jgi:hypothetical protein